MAADRPAASGAVPFLFLRLQEVFHTSITNRVQVFDHAHVVFCTVTFIQALQAFAGVFRTNKTKPYLAFAEQIAGIRHVGAVFPAGDATRAVGPMETLLV